MGHRFISASRYLNHKFPGFKDWYNILHTQMATRSNRLFHKLKYVTCKSVKRPGKARSVWNTVVSMSCAVRMVFKYFWMTSHSRENTIWDVAYIACVCRGKMDRGIAHN